MYIYNFKKTSSKFFLIPAAFLLLLSYEIMSGNGSHSAGFVTLIFISFILVVLWVVSMRFYKKCPNCKKWGTMNTTNKELVDKEQTLVSSFDSKNKGYVNHSATMYQYRIHRKCKNCGYSDYVESDEIKKN